MLDVAAICALIIRIYDLISKERDVHEDADQSDCNG
jgi:hypothetical protein